MNPSAAPPAVKQREPSTTATVVIELTARCILQYVLSVAKIVKCPLNRERAGQYIVVSATARLNQTAANNLMQLEPEGAGSKARPRRFRNRRTQCVFNTAGCTKGRAIKI